MASGPPYLPNTASTGGLPNVDVDVPISAVFLFLYVLGAAGHMTVFQKNRRRGHKFVLSGAMFGFCMSRIVTVVMRIVWATRPTNIRVAIAASIFVNAGILILYIVNIIFAQRLLRAAHPRLGWHGLLRGIFRAAYVLIGFALAMVITCVVQSFYTLSTRTRSIDRGVQLGALTYLMVLAALPLLMLPAILAIPRRGPLDGFGKAGQYPVKFQNRWSTKVIILLIGSCLIATNAGFRTGVQWSAPRPRSDPAWYHAKWCFYFFNFTLEILTIYFYLFVRVDQRFHVPNGSVKTKNYAAAQSLADKHVGDEEQTVESLESVEREKVASTNF